MHNDYVTLIAGADVGTVTEPAEQFAERILPTFAAADIRFAQCERSYSTRGFPPGWGRNGTGEGSGDHTRLHPDRAGIWRVTGIDVVSLASNHTRDWGPDALSDTIDMFHEMGMKTVGAGRSEAEAREPAIFDVRGVKVAFLAYVSVMRNGEQAGDDRAGFAPLRARTYYEPVDYQPGCPPRILTIPYAEDLAALQEDVRKAKERADAVVVSLHWGVHFLPKVIADYQPVAAHAAIDSGADLILGHHTHLINAVEVYNGKVCFYGMGNFMATGKGKGPMARHYYNIYWYPPYADKEQSQETFPFPEDSKKAILVKAHFSKSGIERVAFVPMWLDGRAKPEVLAPDDPRFAEVVAYTEWASDLFPSRFDVDGGEVVVTG